MVPVQVLGSETAAATAASRVSIWGQRLPFTEQELHSDGGSEGKPEHPWRESRRLELMGQKRLLACSGTI